MPVWVRVVACLLTLRVSPVALAQQGTVGALRGTVIEGDLQTPLADVRVTVVEAGRTVTSGADGIFSIQGLPPGQYTVALVKEGYQREVHAGIAVAPGRVTDLGVIEMGIEITEMPEVVVTGEDLLAGSEIKLLEIRQEAIQLQDNIGEEIFKKAGASDAASALKLVTGTTVSEGKYATVRGLSDRYTGTTLNGVRLPASDDRRRAVQVDIFPTGTIESISVTKTFTPDLQGDFTGGGVDIKTKSVPDGPLLSASFGSESDSNATGNDRFLTYRGGGVNFSASSGEGRRMPVPAGMEFPQLGAARPQPRPTAAAQEAAEELDRLTRSFAPAMGVSRRAPDLGKSLSLLVGDRFELGKAGTLGAIGALSWKHDQEFYEDGENNEARIDNIVQPGEGVPLGTQRTDSQGTDRVLLGFLGSVVWRPNDDQEFVLDLVGNRSAKDEARFQTYSGASCGQDCVRAEVQNQSLHYTERDIQSTQLHGHHHFPELFTFGPFRGFSAEWYAAHNTTRQDEPDVRFFANQTEFLDTDGDGKVDATRFSRLTTQGGGISSSDTNRRIFRSIDESSDVGALDVAFDFESWTGATGKVKVGLFRDRTDRGYAEDSYFYDFENTQCCDRRSDEVLENIAKGDNVILDDPEGLWTDVFTDPDRIGLAPNAGVGPEGRPTVAPNQLLWVLQTLTDDVNYAGEQKIDALYAMAELPLTKRFTLIFGARREGTRLRVVPESDRSDHSVPLILAFCGSLPCESFPPGNRPPVSGFGTANVPPRSATADIDETDWLPAVSLVWEPREHMNARLAWSRTLARPTFRELSPVGTEEFLAGDTFVGNPRLVLSNIENYDARWEWFRRPGEVLAASVFYKTLVNPIEFESFFFNTSSVFHPINFEHGDLLGFEVEARTALDPFWKPLKGFAVGFNYTKLDSSVEVPEQTREALAPFALDETERALQGQPAFLFNANVTYDNDRTGSSAALFFNKTGDTLLAGASRGEAGVPNVFQKEYSTLDFTFSQRLPKGLSLSFKAKNLLMQDRETVYRLPDGEEGIRTLRETGLRVSIALAWRR